MKNLKSIGRMITLCAAISFISNMKDSSVKGKMVVGVTYAMSEAGSSNEEAAFVGAIGVVTESALSGTLAGPGGFAAGLIFGL